MAQESSVSGPLSNVTQRGGSHSVLLDGAELRLTGRALLMAVTADDPAKQGFFGATNSGTPQRCCVVTTGPAT